MGLTTDRNDPALHVIEPSGMQEKYLVLSEAERAKGFVRPVRCSYKHVGLDKCLKVLDGDNVGYLCGQDTGHEGECGGVMYADDKPPKRGCGTVTTMGLALSETYARDPKFYGGTFCCGCGKHLPVQEFIWTDDGEVVGS